MLEKQVLIYERSVLAAAKVQLATHKDIDEAIDAAVKAQPAMGAMASYERKAVLEKVSFIED